MITYYLLILYPLPRKNLYLQIQKRTFLKLGDMKIIDVSDTKQIFLKSKSSIKGTWKCTYITFKTFQVVSIYPSQLSHCSTWVNFILSQISRNHALFMGKSSICYNPVYRSSTFSVKGEHRDKHAHVQTFTFIMLV